MGWFLGFVKIQLTFFAPQNYNSACCFVWVWTTKYIRHQPVNFQSSPSTRAIGNADYFHISHFASTRPCGPSLINPLTPNDPYRGRTAPLISKRSILYIYSTNIGTEYFKHGIYSKIFSLQNAVCFIILTYLVPVLFTFYLQVVLKLKKKIILATKC